MGDYILMKKLLTLSIAIAMPLVVLANNPSSHDLINKQIEEIKPPRVGVNPIDVAKTKNPFIMFKVNKKGKKVTYAIKKKVKLTPLKLESSINKSVKINGKWYKEGERVRHYTIVKVSPGEVLLKSKKKELKLYQSTNNKKINLNVN